MLKWTVSTFYLENITHDRAHTTAKDQYPLSPKWPYASQVLLELKQLVSKKYTKQGKKYLHSMCNEATGVATKWKTKINVAVYFLSANLLDSGSWY